MWRVMSVEQFCYERSCLQRAEGYLRGLCRRALRILDVKVKRRCSLMECRSTVFGASAVLKVRWNQEFRRCFRDSLVLRSLGMNNILLSYPTTRPPVLFSFSLEVFYLQLFSIFLDSWKVLCYWKGLRTCNVPCLKTGSRSDDYSWCQDYSLCLGISFGRP